MTTTRLSFDQADGGTRVIEFATMEDGALVLDELQHMVERGEVDGNTAGAVALAVSMRVVHEAKLEVRRGELMRLAARRRIGRWMQFTAAGVGVLSWAAAVAVCLVMVAKE